jgi:hypothetical protein
MTIYSISQRLMENYSIPLKESFPTISDWTRHTIQWIKDLPNQMQKNPRTAFYVFLTANILFFTIMNSYANALVERVIDTPQQLNATDRKFNIFLIDGVVIGGSVLVFNTILSKALNYPLSKSAYAAITLSTIAIRTLFFSSFIEDEIDDSDEEVEIESDISAESITEESPSVESVAEESPSELESKTVEEVKEAETNKVQPQIVINEICQEIEILLKKFCQNINFNEDQKKAQKDFLEQLKLGVATIEDQGDICRAANVPIQAAFEHILSKKLTEGKLRQCKVLFLTGLPCTPLRTPMQKIDKNINIEWKKWTVDVRTQTVRELRYKGATVFVSYSAEDYKKLSESAKGQIEFNTYEAEKNVPNTEDFPLSSAIPKELIGALYLFSDQEGNNYALATQGIQIQHHGETPKERWKMWFGTVGTPEVDTRAQEMLDFVDNNCLGEVLTTKFDFSS